MTRSQQVQERDTCFTSYSVWETISEEETEEMEEEEEEDEDKENGMAARWIIGPFRTYLADWVPSSVLQFAQLHMPRYMQLLNGVSCKMCHHYACQD